MKIAVLRVSGGPANTYPERLKIAKTKAPTEQEPAAPEGNRYTRAAPVLARNDKIDVKTLADRAFMSESTAERCLEAWNACTAALIEVGRLPDPAKGAPPKKTTQKKAVQARAPQNEPAPAAETTEVVS